MLATLFAVAIGQSAYAPCAHAGSNSWTALGPEGGDVREIAMHPVNPDIAVAIAASGVYRTTNGGVAWIRTNYSFQNSPYDLQADPDDPDRLYVFSFSNPHIAVSTDGGVSFQALTLPVTNVSEPRLALGTGGVIYATAGLRVFRSGNRGASWVERGPIVQPGEARIWSLAVDRVDPTTLYASTSAPSTTQTGSMFVSRDGAATWTQLSGPSFAVHPHPTRSGELWAARTDGLWKSTDFGATWSHVHFTQFVNGISLNQRGADLDILVSSYPGVFRSTNGGASWIDITGGNRSLPSLVVAHPVHADRIMAYGYNGIGVPGTSAGTWVTRHAGIIATAAGSFRADASTDRIYAMSNGTIYASSAGGGYVAVNNEPLATLGAPPLPKLVTGMHAQSGTLLALLSDELARSVDGGESWTLVSGVRLPFQSWRLKGAANDPMNLIVRGNPGAHRSTNGGANWTHVTGGLPTGFDSFDAEFAPSNASIVYMSPFIPTLSTPQTYGLYRSTDGGFNWVPANTGIESVGVYDIEVDPSNAQIVYAIAGTALVKSSDGGQSWRTLLPAVGFFAKIALDPANPRIVYVVHAENNLLRSVNGGESFELMRHAGMTPWWNPSEASVDPRRSHVLSVATQGFGVQQMSIEPDLELGWNTAPAPPDVGATVSYTLFVTNRGPYASSGARVTVPFPAEMTDVAASTQSGACTVQQTTVSCTLNSLGLNASSGITISMKARTAGAWSVAAQVQGDQPDAARANNAATLAQTVLAPPLNPTPTTPTSQGGGGGGGSLSLLFSVVAATLGVARRRRTCMEPH